MLAISFENYFPDKQSKAQHDFFHINETARIHSQYATPEATSDTVETANEETIDF